MDSTRAQNSYCQSAKPELDSKDIDPDLHQRMDKAAQDGPKTNGNTQCQTSVPEVSNYNNILSWLLKAQGALVSLATVFLLIVSSSSFQFLLRGLNEIQSDIVLLY
jgi:hypothetical protein